MQTRFGEPIRYGRADMRRESVRDKGGRRLRFVLL